MGSLPGGYYLDHRVVLAAKILLSGLGVFILAIRQAAASARHRRVLDLLLFGVAWAAVLAWPNFGALRGPGHPVALHDVFHYYIGSKYFPELGYTRIYDCAATAEMDSGHGVDVARRWHRDLEAGELFVGPPSPDTQADCRTRFGARWDLFRGDVEWFRDHMAPAEWLQVHTDYGFNATPTWAAIAHWLAGTAPVSGRQLIALTVFDYVLLGLMCALIWRTFGPQVCAVAALWWALSEPTGFRWLGAALLRHDALFCIVAAACALKTGRSRWAGIALAAAVLLRAYPVVILAPLAVLIVLRIRQSGARSAVARYRPLIAGLAAGSLALIAVTEVTWVRAGMGAAEPWAAFMGKAEKHMNTQFTNNLGLQGALSFSQHSRSKNIGRFWLDGPWDTWKAAQRAVFESRKWAYWSIVLAFSLLLVLALKHSEDWVAVALGIAMLPIMFDLSNYYYSVLLVFAFLWPLDPLIGVALAGVSVLTNVVFVFFAFTDDRYVVNSLAVVLLCFLIVYRVAFAAPFRTPTEASGRVSFAAP